MSIRSLRVKVCFSFPHDPDLTLTTTGKFIPTRRTPGVSTSELLERIVSGYRKRDFDDKLVKMGHAELKAEGSYYDERRHASANA